jgi:hypothetical protein
MNKKISKTSLKEIKPDLYDIVEVEDKRTKDGESYFSELEPLREFRGNYGVPRIYGNNVVKGFFKTEMYELDLLESLHNNYIEELNKYIPVIKTKVVREGNLMYLLQPFIPGVTYEKMLEQNFPLEQKSQVFEELLTQALGLIIKSEKIIGIDGKPENWIYNDGKWNFIDTFPPFVIDDKNTFGQIFNLRKFEKNFANNPDRTYFRDPTKIIRRLWLKASKFDSEPSYKELSLDVIQQMELPGSIYKKVMMLK